MEPRPPPKPLWMLVADLSLTTRCSRWSSRESGESRGYALSQPREKQTRGAGLVGRLAHPLLGEALSAGASELLPVTGSSIVARSNPAPWSDLASHVRV